jgi:hypothetical protein
MGRSGAVGVYCAGRTQGWNKVEASYGNPGSCCRSVELKTMKNQVYLSHDHLNDIWRAQVFVQIVRSLMRPRIIMPSTGWHNRETARAEIRERLEDTAITVVLIGSETADRPWVQYELDQSVARGNGLLGIYIHAMEDHKGNNSMPGTKPLIHNGILFPTYDWDWNPEHFWREVNVVARKSAKQKRLSLVYFPSLGW